MFGVGQLAKYTNDSHTYGGATGFIAQHGRGHCAVGCNDRHVPADPTPLRRIVYRSDRTIDIRVTDSAAGLPGIKDHGHHPLLDCRTRG